MIVFKLPDLGEGLQEAEIVEWHVKVGDAIQADQPLVSVETAKAIVEIPSPQSGRVAKLFGQPGDIVHLGAALVAFEGDGGGDADAGTVVGQMPAGQHVVHEAPAALGRGAAGAGAGGVKAMPAVRALARKLDVDLSMVTPMSNVPPRRLPIWARPKCCAACGVRWPRTWPVRRTRWLLPPSSMMPTFTPGRRART